MEPCRCQDQRRHRRGETYLGRNARAPPDLQTGIKTMETRPRDGSPRPDCQAAPGDGPTPGQGLNREAALYSFQAHAGRETRALHPRLQIHPPTTSHRQAPMGLRSTGTSQHEDSSWQHPLPQMLRKINKARQSSGQERQIPTGGGNAGAQPSRHHRPYHHDRPEGPPQQGHEACPKNLSTAGWSHHDGRPK